MESVARCRRPNKASATLSNNNNNNNGGGFSGKSLYDDVYGGPPKFGVTGLSPRFEDYGEIFGSFHTARASSIPLLDLPAVHDAEAFFDPRSNGFNYTEVFGALDFAVSHDNLFHQPTGLDEEAWTSAEIDSFSGESNQSGNNQNVSNGDLFRSFDGDSEFNISYHKVNGAGNGHVSKGKTHMTRLHAVPGFSQEYDETARLHGIDPSYQIADDIIFDTEFSADKLKGNHLKKRMPGRHNFTSGEQIFDSDINLQSGCGRNDSHSSEMFLTVSDISLRSVLFQVPPPSRPPPVLDAKSGDTCGFHSNGSLVASEETPDDNSPPFFDVEVDRNSSGAGSTDAMKETMLRAEAKLRSAKEFKERKKGVHESRVKSSHDLKNNEAKMIKDMSRLGSLNDETTQESYDRRHSKTKISVTDERQKPRKASPETLDALEGKIILNMVEEKHVKESRSSQDSGKSTGVGPLKEESEFFELEGTEESEMVFQPTKLTKILLRDTRNQGSGRKERETSNMQEKYKKVKAIEENHPKEEYEKISEAANEAYEHNENIMRSEPSDEKWRQREHVMKENVGKIFELEENGKKVRMVLQHGKTEKRVTEADQSGILEYVSEMGHKEHKSFNIQKSKDVDRQTPDGGQMDMRLKENEKKPKEVEEKQQSVKGHKQSAEMKESGKTQGEAFALGQAECEENLKDSVELEDIDERSKEDFKQDNTGEIEACRIENEMRLKQILGTEGDITSSNENSHLEQYENMDKDVDRMEKDKELDKALDELEGNEEVENMKFAKATDETWETESEENLFAAQSASIHEENIVKLELSLESDAEQEIGKMRTECKVGEKNLEDIRVENQLPDEKIRAPEVTPGDAEHSATQSGRVDDTVTKADYRSTESSESARVQEAVNVQKSAQLFHVGQSTERKEKSFNETSATVVKDAERMRRERESEKDHLRKVEEEKEREREREKDRMAVDKAMLEAERERERKKDRIAVDKATFEAHDRAYAEACERAERAAFERATADARHRALAEAKERLEKVCAEAREKLYIDKAIIEARLKAERAAVERATAEAQERAMEKLKAERAEFESRERLERSVSDNFGICSRNGGRQDSSSSDMLDPQFQNFSSSADSRYPHSLYGAASFSERSEREGESAQRCRAILERHRRTAERAAKALAEKNMRDLLAQKEQAERNRLAETLDAEVRRWSSGKEGNLRALLSTLQYILGPDSGWQPIPLTEVITSAAVKKAYRKATLCVHPDKLQQRGASIQHKYICEKVFDLLKDAWNKFNSEER